MPAFAAIASSCGPFVFVRGRPFSQTFAYQNPDESPIDLTGATIAAVMDGPCGPLTLTTSAGDDTGIFTASAASTVTAQVMQGRALLALTITDAGGNTLDASIMYEAVTPGYPFDEGALGGVLTLLVQSPSTVVITAAAQQGPAGPSGTGGDGSGASSIALTHVTRRNQTASGTELVLGFTPATDGSQVLRLELNGVYQWPGLDYELAGDVVTFTGAGFAAGDVITYGALTLG